MRTATRIWLVSFLTLAAAISAHAQGSVERGKYVVESVAHCERCHTQRDPQGNPVTSRWLMGGPVQIRASYPNNWATVAPRIAGQPPGTDAEIITLLTKGIWKDGKPPQPPMLQFNMTREDAESVLAYLKSLGK
jgi:mono/diheme cytochrome c family protein